MGRILHIIFIAYFLMPAFSSIKFSNKNLDKTQKNQEILLDLLEEIKNKTEVKEKKNSTNSDYFMIISQIIHKEEQEAKEQEQEKKKAIKENIEEFKAAHSRMNKMTDLLHPEEQIARNVTEIKKAKKVNIKKLVKASREQFVEAKEKIAKSEEDQINEMKKNAEKEHIFYDKVEDHMQFLEKSAEEKHVQELRYPERYEEKEMKKSAEKKKLKNICNFYKNLLK